MTADCWLKHRVFQFQRNFHPHGYRFLPAVLIDKSSITKSERRVYWLGENLKTRHRES